MRASDKNRWSEDDLEAAVQRMGKRKDTAVTISGNIGNILRQAWGTEKVRGGGVGRKPTVSPARRTSESLERSCSSPLFFLITGQAMGKPRMTQRDKWKQRPVVLRYRDWCDATRKAVGCAEKTTLIFPVKMTVRIFLSCPESWSRKKQLAHNGHPHTGKPDVDNIIKGIMDALFTNDSFVFKVLAEKYWTESNPHVAVTIEAVEA